jgi:hypothetical protein
VATLKKFVTVFSVYAVLAACVVEPSYGGDYGNSPGFTVNYDQSSHSYDRSMAPRPGIHSYGYGEYRNSDHDNKWDNDNHGDDNDRHGKKDKHDSHNKHDNHDQNDYRQQKKGWNGNGWQRNHNWWQSGNGSQGAISDPKVPQGSRPWGSK